MTSGLDERLHRSVGADLSELSAARRDFTAWLTGRGVEDERANELAMVMSELGSNAVREAAAHAPVEIAAQFEGRHNIMLQVSNHVSPEILASEWDLDDLLRSGGRGLLVVAALTDSVEVDHAEGRIVIRCRATV